MSLTLIQSETLVGACWILAQVGPFVIDVQSMLLLCVDPCVKVFSFVAVCTVWLQRNHVEPILAYSPVSLARPGCLGKSIKGLCVWGSAVFHSFCLRVLTVRFSCQRNTTLTLLINLNLTFIRKVFLQHKKEISLKHQPVNSVSLCVL